MFLKFLWRSPCIRMLHNGSIPKIQHVPLLSKHEMNKVTLPKSCDVIYCHTRDHCHDVCHEIMASISTPIVVGLDAEWKPMFDQNEVNKVAVIQICTSFKKCYIFHLSCIGHIPFPLKHILTNRWIIKVGNSVEEDLVKLWKDYFINNDVDVNSIIDLNKYANSIGLTHHTYSQWGLATLTESLLQKRLEKNVHVQLSDWEQYPLTKQQIDYAAFDAFMGLLLFKYLERERISNNLTIFEVPYLAKKLPP